MPLIPPRSRGYTGGMRYLLLLVGLLAATPAVAALVAQARVLPAKNDERAWAAATNPRECGLFDEIIRLGPPAGGAP